MTGLLIKDLLVSKKYLRSLGIILVLYAVLFGVIGTDTSFLPSFIMIFCALFTATTFSYDEQAKWDKFALTLPVTRSMVVRSKYAFTGLLTLVGGVCSVVCQAAIAAVRRQRVTAESWISLLVIFLLVLLIESLLLPLLYKFGAEKGRYLLIGAMVLIALGLVLLGRSGADLPDMGQTAIWALSAAGVPVLVLILLASYWASCRIYCGKEF